MKLAKLMVRLQRIVVYGLLLVVAVAIFYFVGSLVLNTIMHNIRESSALYLFMVV